MKNPLITEILGKFEEKVNQVRRLDARNGASEIVEFGCKEKMGNVIYTLPDWGNVKNFLKSSLLRLGESCPLSVSSSHGPGTLDPAPHDDEVSFYNGYNTCTEKVQEWLESIKQALK